MKIRNGFVSNSSSSSFVIPTWDFKEGDFLSTTYDVAKYMISCREDSGWKNDELIDKLNEAIKNGKIDKDSAICFHTCNYDTYIMKSNDRIYIDTCNNHDFNELDIWYSGENTNFYMGDLMNGKRFYFLEYDIFVTSIPYESCKKEKCWGEKYKADDGNIYCIDCELEKFRCLPKLNNYSIDELRIKALRLQIEIFAKEWKMKVEEVIEKIKEGWKNKENK